MRYSVQQNTVIEISFTSTGSYQDPYNDVDVDVRFTGPDDVPFCVPAFWAGDNRWKVRFAGAKLGDYHFKTEATIREDGLHGQEGRVAVEAYSGDNPLFVHGRLKFGVTQRHFESRDGTPFFWIGDTWWMALLALKNLWRIAWPSGST